MTIELQPWADGDLPLVHRMNTPEMTSFLGGAETDAQVLDRHERYLRGWRDGTAWMHRIEVDGEAVGGIGYWPVEHDGVPAFETGWSIVTEWQGRGVATAALRRLIRRVVEDGSRDVLVAFPGADNEASNALCRSAGFAAGEVLTHPWRGGELTFRVWRLDVSALELADREPLVDERFAAGELDRERWWPYYTPHWSSRARTRARWRTGAGLELRIDADTEPWAPEWDGDLRVSHLQSGQFSGAVGSPLGQHRFRPDLVVREEQPEHRGWLAHHGVIEARLAAVRHPDAMVAFWPIGFEERPERSGEICIAEIFGSEVGADGGWVGVGVKPQNDPRLALDFEKIWVDGDLTEPHDYAVDWDADRLRFFIDGRLVKTVRQTIDYPVQLMLDVFEFARADGIRDLAALPHVLRVERVRTLPGQWAATTASTASP